MELIINQNFLNLLDLPSDTERKELERQLLRDGGPRDPIVVWKEKNTIVDGHNRYGICKAHGLKFETVMRSFKDETAVEEWILENQLARRNLSPARSSYFLGLLYNKYKQDPTKARTPMEGDKTMAETLGQKFGVSEKTVRRAGQEAKGIDVVAKVKGIALNNVTAKLNAIKDKNTGVFTREELQELGKAKEEVAEIAAKIMVDEKTEIAEALKQVQAAKPAPVKKTTAKTEPKKDKPLPYNVVLSEPQFDRQGWSPAIEERPSMSEHSICYMIVPDEELVKGIDLLKKWGLSYEGSYIVKVERYEGVWSDVHHQFLLIGTKGTPAAPKKLGKSIVEGDTVKMIESYHNGARKLDMRKTPAQGWDKK